MKLKILTVGKLLDKKVVNRTTKVLVSAEDLLKHNLIKKNLVLIEASELKKGGLIK
jgi:hypothetical protein